MHAYRDLAHYMEVRGDGPVRYTYLSDPDRYVAQTVYKFTTATELYVHDRALRRVLVNVYEYAAELNRLWDLYSRGAQSLPVISKAQHARALHIPRVDQHADVGTQEERYCGCGDNNDSLGSHVVDTVTPCVCYYKNAIVDLMNMYDQRLVIRARLSCHDAGTVGSVLAPVRAQRALHVGRNDD